MNAPTVLRRYSLRVRDYDWAIVVLGSDGFFSAVSSFGNYAYIWGAFGSRDFREFVIQIAEDPYYTVSKLAPRLEYDDEETLKNVKAQIKESVKNGELTKEKADEELELLEEYGDLSSEFEFHQWFSETSLDTYEVAARRHNSNAVAFCKEAVPALAKVLREELALEAAKGGE